MTQRPLSLKLHDWPELDRALWLSAQQPAGFLEPSKRASKWSPAGVRLVESMYGAWLSFLVRRGTLDPGCTPGERVTEEHLKAYIAELQCRTAPVGLAMRLGCLLRAITAMEPGRDFQVLRKAHAYFKLHASPSRDKLARMVPAADLLALGIQLMDTAEDVQTRGKYKATRYRDGLLIAVLICCPIRLKNLAMIIIGRHLLFDGCAYRLEFTAEETKTGRPYVAELPAQLTPYLQLYLVRYRPSLQLTASQQSAGPATGPLWPSRWGTAMQAAAVRHQIKQRTSQAFGKALWPHLFRDCAVTELVDLAPEEIGMAHDLLGHQSLATTQKHYLQAKGMSAHQLVQKKILERRRRSTV
jgi:integrase/recombinase XerD